MEIGVAGGALWGFTLIADYSDNRLVEVDEQGVAELGTGEVGAAQVGAAEVRRRQGDTGAAAAAESQAARLSN